MAGPQELGESMKRTSQILLVLLTVTVAGLIVVCLAIAPSWLVARDTDVHALTAEQRIKATNDARGALLQGVGGLFLALGAIAAWRQLRVASEGQITERFTHAVDQLGNQELDVRLGGIYALERIARDSRADRSTIAEVLSAYVRTHSPWHPPQPEESIEKASIEETPFLQERAPDVQAALTVLGRFPGRAEERSINLRAADLCKANLKGANLEGALFEVANLAGAQLNGANLKKAYLYLAHLEEASFWRADLTRSSLGRAFLREAVFWHARSEGANFSGASLVNARLNPADLRKARFINTLMQGAHLQGADLRGANLSGAKLEGALSDDETKWPDNFDWSAAGVTQF